MRKRTIVIIALFVLALFLLFFTDVLVKRSRWLYPSGSGSTVSAGPAPDVGNTARQAGFETKDATEPTVMKMVVQNPDNVKGVVLLAPEDRSAFLAWTDSADSQGDFDKIKRLVHSSFSSGARDIIDERQTEAGKPQRDVLSFLDPAIHPERLLFVRCGGRLYEFHIAPGQEAQVDRLLDLLTD